ncbi:AMP-binding protein [Xenorhabdus bovienii]|uniref:AMP-binding protein n=1 Tax=Xenorhabdus bovienii TaxID=40576 RepID=UPI0023B28B56|nr:AMP-binding protein [Xenorhabdus bovienii]MDE9447715.1 AMP-binding protein [Xenorhabdus bovienii]MDE9536729.1 AMP-binding protein [Xenorhabdus bovienii]MDE9589759.1 AMP-binding protein [Xenorhabdus bovienii]
MEKKQHVTRRCLNATEPLRHCGDIEVINEYGPTEATVGSTIFRTHASKAEAKVPIGRPIRNVTHYVLNHNVLNHNVLNHGVSGNGNEEMTLAPIGMAGELYIGGMGVALGYVNNPLLTAQRFVTTPFRGIAPISAKSSMMLKLTNNFMMLNENISPLPRSHL